jgi:hypothetical protein
MRYFWIWKRRVSLYLFNFIETEENQFVIIHLNRSYHVIQCLTASDKYNWLRLAEYNRKEFCLSHQKTEIEYFTKASKDLHARLAEETDSEASGSFKLLRNVTKGSKSSRSESSAIMETLSEEHPIRVISADSIEITDEKYSSQDLLRKDSPKKKGIFKHLSSFSKFVKKLDNGKHTVKSLENLESAE